MKEVSKEEFYKIIWDGRLDLTLKCEREYASYRYRYGGEFGRAYPGYLGKGPKKYTIAA